MSAPLLELRNLCYSYDGERPALQDLNVSIAPGERVAVLGNNGAGKSTFFLCCNGVLAPQSGEILLHGELLTRKKADLLRLREAVGLVFQDPDDQIIAATVAAEVSFGPMNLRLERQEVARRVAEALAALRLQEFRERPPHYLSGGEKKLVTIADILAMQPRLILFDEPTSSLDPQNTARLQEVLRQLSEQGLALMVATHDLDFAWSWAERLLVFQEGRLIADASPEAVFADAALLQRAALPKPTLYAAAEAVCAARELPFPAHPPKSQEEFQLFVKECY